MVTWGASLGAIPRLFIFLLSAGQLLCRSYLLLMLEEDVSCEKSRKGCVNLGNQKGRNRSAAKRQISQAPGTHCTRKSPLPLLPSGPGGVGESTSRETDA